MSFESYKKLIFCPLNVLMNQSCQMFYYHTKCLLDLISFLGEITFNIDGKQVDFNDMIIVIVKCIDYSWIS